jgi:hypothetical protein
MVLNSVITAHKKNMNIKIFHFILRLIQLLRPPPPALQCYSQAVKTQRYEKLRYVLFYFHPNALGGGEGDAWCLGFPDLHMFAAPYLATKLAYA